LSLKGINSRLKIFLLITILFTLGNSSDSFIILRAQERGLNVLQTMFMLMTFTAIYATLSSPLGALSDKVGRRKLIIGGWLAYAFVYLGFALANAGWQIWMLFGFYGIYYAATEYSLWSLQRGDRNYRPACFASCRASLAGCRDLDGIRPFCTFSFWLSAVAIRKPLIMVASKVRRYTFTC
jgi:MFS family permease